MSAESISRILDGIDEKYILEAAELSIGSAESLPSGKRLRSLGRTVLIAAVISCLIAVSAFARGSFSIFARNAAQDENVVLSYTDPDGFERSVPLDDIKYVFEFSGQDECPEIEFRPGWLPFEPNEIINPKSEDGFYSSRLVSELTPEAAEEYHNYQPYSVTVYYTPEFTNGNKMLLHYQSPDEIIREQWGTLSVMKFTAHQEQPGYENEYYFVILFSEDEGYIIVVSGTSDAETVEHIARELEIRQTDRVIKSTDFDGSYAFIDVSIG